MMYFKATVNAQEFQDSEIEENVKIVVFIEPGMTMTELKNGTGIKTMNGSFLVNEKIDKIIDSIKSLET